MNNHTTTSNPVQRVLDALKTSAHEPKQSGTGWMCRCPAHDDRNPSLSITPGDDGRALLKCHAGCSTESVIEAIGLKMCDLFLDEHSAPNTINASTPKPKAIHATAQLAVEVLERTRGPRTKAWTYHDADGEPVGMVVRWDTESGKVVRPVSRNGAGWFISGMPEPRPLYGLPDLLKAEGVVYVCEGEKAADTAQACGLIATTSPHGSKSAGKADWAPLAGRDVVILPDHDEPGEKYAQVVHRLAREAGAASVKIVRLIERWPELPKSGDMADVLELAQGDTDAIREAVEVLTAASKPEKTPPDTSCGSPVLVCMNDVEAQEVNWLWTGRLPLGRLSLLVGRPGEGKSFATLDWAARVSTGSDWPDGSPCESGSVLLVSAEDDPGDTIRPRLDAHDADSNRIHMLKGVHTHSKNGKRIEAAFTLADLDPLRQALSTIGNVRLIVIDPIGSYVGGRVDAHRDNEVRAVLAPLAALAQETGAAVVLVAHQRKAAAVNPDDMVLGSKAFTGLARSVLHLMRDPDDEDRRLLLPGKMNLSVPAPGLAFTIGDEPARVQWEANPVNITASEVLAKSSGRNNAGDEAGDWLRDVLSNGPMPVGELKSMAEQDGLAWRTIERAKKRIGVKATREGFSSGGRWMWAMPTIDRHDDPKAAIDTTEEDVADYGGVCDSEHTDCVQPINHHGLGLENEARIADANPLDSNSEGGK
ncbi:MAG: AAA family ATPase [Phycisphaerales bacterium]|nr:AAA family ATPase [Phycisphaerales bacterium]